MLALEDKTLLRRGPVGAYLLLIWLHFLQGGSNTVSEQIVLVIMLMCSL